MHRRARVSALVAFVVLLAGCGGNGPSAEKQWASEVCSSVLTWRNAITTVAAETADAVTKPAQARSALRAAAADGKSATEQLVSELDSLTPPDTPEGRQAKQQLDAFEKSVESTAAKAQHAVSGIGAGSSLSDIVSSLSGLGAELQATLESARQLATSLAAAGGAIKDGFESAGSCDELSGGG